MTEVIDFKSRTKTAAEPTPGTSTEPVIDQKSVFLLEAVLDLVKQGQVRDICIVGIQHEAPLVARTMRNNITFMETGIQRLAVGILDNMLMEVVEQSLKANVVSRDKPTDDGAGA